MAKNINHLQHVKSSVVENGLPKLPAPNVLVEGELAVNYATDKETISLKNSSGIVVTFSSDNYYSEKKLGSGFTGENSAVTVTQAINDSERVVAAALTDLDERKLDASAYTPTDLSEYATKQWVDEERLGSGFTGENSGNTVTKVIEDNELAISAALNDLNTRKLDTSGYTPGKLDIWRVTDFDFASAGYSCDDLTPYIQGEKYLVIFNTRDESNYVGGYYMFGFSDMPYGIINGGDMSFTVLFDCSGDSITVYEYIVDEYYNTVSSVTMNGSTIESVNKNINLGTVVSSVTVNGSAVTVTNGVAPINITATYDSNTKKIYLKNGNATMSEIDATDFIKDGMVNDVVVDKPVSGSNSGVTCLIVTFNTDAGKEDIEIPLSEMFDSELYYTKEEVNTMLGDDFIDFSGESFSSVTDIIRADETVMAAALNDLNDRKLDASAYTPSEFTDLLDEKLGYWFSGDSLSSVTDVIRENEIIVSSALNDLESRKLDASAYTPTDLSGYYTKQEIDEDKLGSGFTGDNSGTTVTDAFNTVERVVAAALTDLDDRKLDASAFTESVGDFYTKEKVDDKLGEWFSGDTPISSVTEVIREDELAISAALNDLDGRKLDASAYTPTDLSGYYTKQEIDEDKLGSGFTGENSGKTVTQAINETEIVVAAALTDLDDRKLDASAYTQPDLSAYATKEWIEDDVLGSGFTTGDYSGKSITEVIEENELIISSALNDLDERIDELSGNTGVGTIVSGEYSNGTLYLDKNDGTSIEVSGFTTGGGGGTGDLSGVTFNGVAATKSNGIAAITANVVSSVTMNSTNKSINNGALDLGTVITAETQLSTATTGTGVVVTGLTVSNHKITTNMGNITLDNVADGSTRKLPTALSALTDDATHRLVTDTEKTSWNNAYTSAHSHSNKSVLDGITTAKTASWDTVTAKADNSAFTAHTASTDVHVTASEKSTWNGKQDAITDLASIRTSAATQSDWNATSGVGQILNKPTIPTSLSQLTSAHTHAISEVTNLQTTLNAKVSGININNSGKVTPTNGVANLTIDASTVGALPTGTTLDNVADGTTRKLSDYSLTSHTHDEYATTGTVNTLNNTVTEHTANTTAHVTAANKTQWNNAISGVSFNGATATVNNHVAAITATIPAAPGTLTTTATTAQSTATNEALSGNIALHKVSKTGSYNDLNDKPTIPAAANNATITLQFGNSSSAFTVNASSNLTINLATLIGIPAPTASDNGKILGVVNGAFAWITPTTIYTGSGTPSSSQGNNGDIYLQTS